MSQKLVLQVVVSLLLASILPLDYVQAKGGSNGQISHRKDQELASSIFKNFYENNDAICRNWHDEITVNINSSQQFDGIMKIINLCELRIPFITLTTYIGCSSSSHNSCNNDSIFGPLKPLPYNAEQRSSALIPGVPSFGCLKPSLSNPRYFTDGSGKGIYLTGSHTWNNLLDMGKTDPPEAFDYNSYLDFLKEKGHNFIRLWAWELTKGYKSYWSYRYTQPFPWQRTGPGTALDGKPKFNLRKFEKKYFNRLRSRVIAAGKRGIYVSIMLFEGHCMYYSETPWRWDGHPFNENNNINGINGDPDGDGRGIESHTLQILSIVKLQEKYVKKVIDAVNDLDNVLYEISNEDHEGSVDWQYHMINFIRDYEKTKPKQHSVGMTTTHVLGNEAVFNSSAEWISPAVSKWGDPNDPYKVNPPIADGSKVIILDTDHLWGMGGDRVWVWKSFLRGYNPIYMDNLDSDTTREEARRAMGHTLTYANKMNLKDMPPRNDLTSTTYCLANPGFEYLVYQPESNTSFTVNLAEGKYGCEWFNPGSGTIVLTGSFTATNGNKSFTPPFNGDAVLYIFADKER